jgi:hypothetical protein
MLVPRVFSGVSAIVMYPIHSINVWLEESSGVVPTFFRDKLSLQEEIEELENEVIVAGRTNVTRQRLAEENNRLRQLLGIDNEERIAASVIGRPNELPYDLLQIDRGSLHGVEVGAPVFIGRDIVIGLVAHTAPTYSFVELVTTPGFEATVFISGPDIVATMEGFGGGVARVKVPQGIPLRVGNLVNLPSVEPGVFGRISHVENRPTQPEQYGYISPDIAISSLHLVAVGKLSQVTRSAEEISENVLEEIRRSLLVPGVEVGEVASSTDILEAATSSEEEY